MPRFYLPNHLDIDQTITLPENIIRHIKVLRLKSDSYITLFNGQNCEYQARLKSAGKNIWQAIIIKELSPPTESPLNINLIQVVSTGEKMDFTVQKATELGVNQIYPVISQHSNVRLSEERAIKRTRRWQEIAIASCEQCGRNTIPKIFPIQNLNTALTQAPTTDIKLLLSPQGSIRLRNIEKIPKTITLLIGAEGGLSDNEEKLAQQSNFLPIRLGQRILRTETAGLATLAAIQTIWGDF
ncbi:MAG: 16S rRNA (uracil(1498)-N(3))-methyltransferase [Neisseriaceae bacterium]|nr:16S rRNA (uracil(1498)-N(3))-methyltransferase [Neisseriaceae bacterium]